MPYQPRPYGEIRSAPKSALDKLLAEGLDAPGADIYAPTDAAPAVVPMPARSAPPAELENPFAAAAAAADRHASLEDALLAFGAIYPYPLSASNRAVVSERIQAAGAVSPGGRIAGAGAGGPTPTTGEELNVDILTRKRFGLPADPWAAVDLATGDAARVAVLVAAAASDQALTWITGVRGAGKDDSDPAGAARAGRAGDRAAAARSRESSPRRHPGRDRARSL